MHITDKLMFWQDKHVDSRRMMQRLIANVNNRQIPVKRPLESFGNVDAESQRILDLWNKHLCRLVDRNGQPPFQAELPSPWIEVHEDWYSADGTRIDPRKRSRHLPVHFACAQILQI